jgi:L-lactate dehydrogenase complex protein LldG
MEEFGQLAQASSLCGACKDACPVDIDLPRLLTRVRAGRTLDLPHQDGIALAPLSRIGLRAYGIIGSSPRIFRIAQWLGGIVTRIVSPFAEWFPIPAFTGWGYSKDFPRVAARSFRRQFAARRAEEPQLQGQPVEQSEEPASVPPQEPAVERFCRELEALGGQVQRVSRAEANEKVLAFLQAKGIGEAASWDRVEGLDLAWLAQHGIRLMHEPMPALKAGISGATAAIAETGTLLITSGSGQPLGASLLHEVHVAVVPESKIVWTLEEALRDPALPEAAAGVLITGPSRTADIEMTLTIGVHGPKEIAVFVVE